jgi:hypothetical protein
MLRDLWDRNSVFDGRNALAFGISCDPEDERTGRVADRIPGFRIFWDFDFRISAQYGICSRADSAAPWNYSPATLVLDPNLRVLAVFRFAPAAAATHAARVADFVLQLPHWAGAEPAQAPGAPILVCPRVFEREFCRELIALYERHGGKESGVMRTDYVGGGNGKRGRMGRSPLRFLKAASPRLSSTDKFHGFAGSSAARLVRRR